MENPIPITSLNDFVFCPASIYFHRFYDGIESAVFKDTAQINGTAAHKSIDENNYSTSSNVVTSLSVYSEQFYVTGKIDMYFKKECRLVERKKYIKKIYDGYVFQLYAQYYSMLEMGYDVESIQLYSMDDNKKYNIKLPDDDPDMLYKFTDTISELMNFKLEEFKQTNIEKCRNCIYEPACDRTLL